MLYPQHDRVSQDYPVPFGQGKNSLALPVIASNFRQLDADSPSKKPETSKSRPDYLAG
ncbi:uncharacterized protein ARMOST_22608 [Armillaria ostoyae]|uniref:Uncharacterized protein n=1 Tax=Armillaria ostoyae TaxID=47428 RepID=A0A284SDF8_ARMOS|nr:uncharacterized protein ARMOST_22608 [Armillaria ostoyae]